MPPKVNTDDKLSQMRSYVAANVAQLASSEKATLKDMFGARQRECREEASFYKFLWSYEKSFTNAQRTHAEETLAILTQYGARSGDAHPAANAGSDDAHPAAALASGAERSRNGSHDDCVRTLPQEPSRKRLRSKTSCPYNLEAAGHLSGGLRPAESESLEQRPLHNGDSQPLAPQQRPGSCSFSQPVAPSKCSAEATPSGGVPQPTAEKESNVVHNNETKRKTLLLQLKRPHYNAIKDGRKLWEARPLFDGRWQPTIYDKLGVIGNVAVLQSGADTNDRVRIAEVRRYTPQGLSCSLQEMLAELGADLLPDVADDRARAAVYESLYGFERCTRGFVAMRFLWPNGAAAATKNQRTSSNTAPVASMSLVNDVPQATGPSAEHAPQHQTFDMNGRVRWGTHTCVDENGCRRCF